ncbi:unnamed protein product [Candida verbasci]|uniref:GAF domain-containing protein n=1 Tax=Candida verbasci TaxID=1227364 RepID=A0A9W4X9V6_9ASCO|nr:unnamed protein product [Candida verbasci]
MPNNERPYPTSQNSIANEKFKRSVPLVPPILTKKVITKGQNQNGKQVSLLGSSNDVLIKSIESTKSHFLDSYSKGQWNLSTISCPPFIDKSGFFKPPEFYNELSRLNDVGKYMKSPHWSESALFKRTIAKLKKKFYCLGVSISIIDNSKVYYKVETMLNLSVLPRFISIDSHSLLSKDYMLVLDASRDWRFYSNPLVANSPLIKFYCGVPLIAPDSNQIIGILSIFDNSSKESFAIADIEILKVVANDIMITLDTPFEEVMTKLNKNEKKNIKSSADTYYNNLNNLKNQIGRPTGATKTLVFEKDGSGSPYNQNEKLKYLNYKNYKAEEKDESSSGIISDKELWQFLISVGSLKKAATVFSKLITTNYPFEFVYILEIRTAELFQIPREYCPTEESIDYDKFELTNKMIKVNNVKDEFMTRVIGLQINNQAVPKNDFFKHNIHLKCCKSEFGIEVRNINNSSVYNHGLLLPFYKFTNKLTHKTQSKGFNSKDKMTDLYLKSGGFLIGLFNEKSDRVYDQDLISNIYNHACIYRKIYINT